jgi:hypothetical protein
MLLPGEVNKDGVRADRNNFSANFLEPVVLLCQSSKLGGSDECEIRGVEKQDGPFTLRFQIRQTDLAEITLLRLENVDFEIGHRVADSQ